jgi:hypothetical protein
MDVDPQQPHRQHDQANQRSRRFQRLTLDNHLRQFEVAA